MKNGLIVMLVVMTAMATLVVEAREKPEKLADWITVVSYPKKVKIGEEVEIKIKLNGIPDGQFIGGDMHFFRGPSYGGFLVWAAPLQVEKGKKEYIFKFKVGKKTDMTAVAVLFYVGREKGYKNKEKEAWLKGIIVK